MNDINLSCDYGGGREYFDRLCDKLSNVMHREGRFYNDHSKYPGGYKYGETSDGQFPCNKNKFNLSKLEKFSPFDTCASAQMIIKKVK